jgi:hypothetical protein
MSSLHWKFFWSPSDQKNHPQKKIITRELFIKIYLDRVKPFSFFFCYVRIKPLFFVLF